MTFYRLPLTTAIGLCTILSPLVIACDDGTAAPRTASPEVDAGRVGDTGGHDAVDASTSSDEGTDVDATAPGGLGPKQPVEVRTACDLRLDMNSVVTTAPCPLELSALPAVRVGGELVRFEPAECAAEGPSLHCQRPGFGEAYVRLGDDTAVAPDGARHRAAFRASFRAATKLDVQSVGLVAQFAASNEPPMLSHGFESWSQSGVIRMPTSLDETELEDALGKRGEDEVYRRGGPLSWWYSFVQTDAGGLVLGATTSARERSFVVLHRSEEALAEAWIMSGHVPRAIEAAQTVESERFVLYAGTDLHEPLTRYGAQIASRRDTHPMPAPIGWNSWYDLWDDVTEADLLDGSRADNATLSRELLSPLRPSPEEPLWFVVDDGWQIAWGDWETNEKFPSGIAGLAKKVQARGMRLGLWVAPFLVAPDSAIFRDHPEWLVDDVRYAHPAHGDMGVLDVTHPEAAAHLQSFVRALVDQGVELLKIDFLFAGTWEGGRREAITGMQAYARGLELIRAAAGDETLLLSVGAPPLTTFRYVDGWRVGNDIAFKPFLFGLPRPSFSFIANQARQVAARYPFCLRTLCDADPALLRSLPRHEVETGAFVASLTGGAFFLSDDLRRLDSARRSWGLDQALVARASSGIPATPTSFVPTFVPDELVNMRDPFLTFSAEHHLPSEWVFADGTRFVAAFGDKDIETENGTVRAHAVRAMTLDD